MDKIIQISNFSKKYGFFGEKWAVNKAEMGIGRGSFHGLIGSNGAGKTTIIKSIIGSFTKTEGEIKIANQSGEKSFHKMVYIPEKSIFPNNFTVYNYLLNTLYLSHTKISKKEAKIKVKKALEHFEISDLQKQNPNKLSSGQKKKVLLARIIINEPKILILDEPTTNLDPKSRRSLFLELKKLNNKGITILVCSHNLDEIQDFLNEITIIEEGKILYNGVYQSSVATISKTLTLKLKDYSLLEKYLIKNKVKYILGNDQITINNINSKDVMKIMKHLNNEEVEILSMDIIENKEKLIDVYNKIIKNKGGKND